MSRSYNQWPNSYDQQRLQLEPELAHHTSNDRQHQDLQPATYSNTFPYTQPSSSSLHNAVEQPTSQIQRSVSLGASGPPQNNYMRGGFPPNHLPMNTASYRSDTGPIQYPSSAFPKPVNMADNNFLTASPLQSQFTPPSSSTNQQTYYRGDAGTSGSSIPPSKRFRAREQPIEDEQDGEFAEKEGAKKHSGACARCKTLKVKCEFINETDVCKRCLNGGHDCTVPGRKKRRVPPKREHLINQIRAQAEQINHLIAQLENNHRSQGQPPNLETSPSTLFHSPLLSADGDSFDTSSVSSKDASGLNAEGNRAIEDWLAKAKESFVHFGNSIAKSYVSDDTDDTNWVEDEYDNVERSDLEGYGDEDDKYEIAVEGVESTSDAGTGHRLRTQSSNSSINTTTASVASTQPRKKTSGDKVTNLPSAAAPWGLMGRLSLYNRTSSMDSEEHGITSSEYFTNPSPAPDEKLKDLQRAQPHILKCGIISTSDAEKLFTIYFDKMNDSTSLLDPKLYSPQSTAIRSSFLFTVICATASRFYAERPDLYPQLMHYAQLAAGTALISGAKNVDMCAAYILLSLYPVPTRRMTEQRSWLYLGLAIRTATDLNLHIPAKEKPRNEYHAREILNRTRIWLNCYNLDRSTGSQYGKPPIINNFDYTANHSEDWFTSSPYSIEHFDIHICVYNAELRVMASFMASIHNDPEQPTGLNKNADFEAISTATDDKLKALWQKWLAVLDTTDMSVPQNRFRTGLLRLAYSYSRLIALSYGFQHAFGKNSTDENPFLNRCLDAARDVVNAVLYHICVPEQLFYWRHGPEAQSIFVTFAAAFLIKLLHPRFASYLSPETRDEIKRLVQKVVELLSSKEIAIDERHGPGLYARFLRNLLQSPILRQTSFSRSRIPKSAGATPELSDNAPLSNHASPLLRSSMSPPPSQEMTSFDMFAPVGVGATDPYFQGLDNAATGLGLTYMTDPTGNGGTVSDLFNPPLGGDHLIMQNMQVVGGNTNNLFDWQSNAGYAWFPQFQQNMGMNTLFDNDYPMPSDR